MTTKKTKPGDVGELRERAEERLKEVKEGRAVAQVRDESPNAVEIRRVAEACVKEKMKVGGIHVAGQEMQQIFHELEVHQIELDMQNEELRRTQVDVTAAWAQYFDLYDLAPVGYCTVSEEGLILQANLTSATLLGVTRSVLVKHPFSKFIIEEDQDTYYLHRKKLSMTGKPQAYEARMLKKDGTVFWAHLETTAAEGADGAPVCRVAMIDITEMKNALEALHIASEEIKTLRGILPICANCKRIRDDQGDWKQMEIYVSARTEAQFSHGLCPECVETLYPGIRCTGE